MKVYYEKPDGFKIMQDAISLAEKYKSVTGKKPNRISMTRKEFDTLDSYFAENYPCYKIKKESAAYLSIAGMEIIISDN